MDLFIYFFFKKIIHILLSHFLTPKGWRVVRVLFFFLFVNFLYCVLSFCYHFLLLPGEGGVGLFFIFLIIVIYILNKNFGTFFAF